MPGPVSLIPDPSLPVDYEGSAATAVIFACDLRYYIEGIDLHIATRHLWQSNCQLIVFVDVDQEHSSEFSKLSRRAIKAGILVYPLKCQNLDDLCKGADAPNLRVNYVKCARYALAAVLLQKYACLARVIVADYDSLVLADLSPIGAPFLSGNGITITWDSSKCPNPEFPSSLVFGLDGKLGFPHLILKAGFAVFHRSDLSLLFLRLFVYYSFGPKREARRKRLFNSYYGDQLSLFLALLALKNHHPDLFSCVGWLDYCSSRVIGTDVSSPNMFFYPKGRDSFVLLRRLLVDEGLITSDDYPLVGM